MTDVKHPTVIKTACPCCGTAIETKLPVEHVQALVDMLSSDDPDATLYLEPVT